MGDNIELFQEKSTPAALSRLPGQQTRIDYLEYRVRWATQPQGVDFAAHPVYVVRLHSNVNGALGIWGSRYNKNVQGKRLSQTSLQELLDGPYTFELRFCSALDPGGSFSCN